MAVVIVNYRTGGLVVECLASLAPEVATRPRTRVIVVDNASGDDSCDRIDAAIRTRGWSTWAELVRSPTNGGFGAGNNLAVRRLLAQPDAPDAIWLLNPDTRAQPDALDALVRHLQSDPACGIAGSLLFEGDGNPWPIAFRFPTWQGEAENAFALGVVTRLLADHVVAMQMGDRPAPTDWVSGASMMVRREVFETIGLMDEGFFLYYEETDFARRARDAGWTCWFVPESRVVHIAGQSTGVTATVETPRRRPAYWFESRRRYYVKHHGRAYAVAADLAYVVGRLVWHLLRIVHRRPNTDPPKFVWDLLRHSALLNV